MDYRKAILVYVAGKLNADAVGYLHNVAKLMKNCEDVKNAGMGYFCPAIDLLMGIKFNYDKYEDYFDNGQVVLLHSDAVFVTEGWETSEGTKMEIKLAEEYGIPVFYSLSSLIDRKDVLANARAYNFLEDLVYKGMQKNINEMAINYGTKGGQV